MLVISAGLQFCDFIIDLFFFFKQKTAYEMRISDWSSDVCSSDLPRRRLCCPGSRPVLESYWCQSGSPCCGNSVLCRCRSVRHLPCLWVMMAALKIVWSTCRRGLASPALPKPPIMSAANLLIRSEEHTSELQSLLRISYAVFCLKKKTKTTYNTYEDIN